MTIVARSERVVDRVFGGRTVQALPLILMIGAAPIACGDEQLPEWHGPGGPTSLVSSSRGAEHCGWESMRIIGVHESILRPGVEAKVTYTFVHDPRHILRESSTAGHFERDALMPDDAVDTGYHSGDQQLWVSPSEDVDAIYLVGPKRVERWPGMRAGCA